MRAIIQGKRYDTNTAELVAEWGNNLGSNDFRNVSEELYRTKKGNWFIAGEGGARSRYSQSCGNGSVGGSAIVPLTAEEARDWLESKDAPAALEEYFGSEIEDA